MRQEDFNEIRDKIPSPEAEIEYQERLKNQEIRPLPIPSITHDGITHPVGEVKLTDMPMLDLSEAIKRDDSYRQYVIDNVIREGLDLGNVIGKLVVDSRYDDPREIHERTMQVVKAVRILQSLTRDTYEVVKKKNL